MSYALRSGVTYCVVSGRTLFLDIPRDQYFCLSAHAALMFDAVATGRAVDPQEVEKLLRVGIIVLTDGHSSISPCPRPTNPHASLLDTRTNAGAAGWESARALLTLGATGFRLRYRGLERSLRAISRRKARLQKRDDVPGRLEKIALGYRNTRVIVSDQDRCLVRSLAIARRLLAARIAPDLVLGVKLQPFKAHCWVQVGSVLINERCEVARDYTPILVV